MQQQQQLLRLQPSCLRQLLPASTGGRRPLPAVRQTRAKLRGRLETEDMGPSKPRILCVCKAGQCMPSASECRFRITMSETEQLDSSRKTYWAFTCSVMCSKAASVISKRSSKKAHRVTLKNSLSWRISTCEKGSGATCHLFSQVLKIGAGLTQCKR